MTTATPTPTKTITFRTIEQAALWLELDGQISDGAWENALPNNHWEVWCEATVAVGPNVGRNFRARKDNYDFTRKDLLDVVAPRMLAIVRIARKLGLEVAAQLEHAPDTKDGTIDWNATWMRDRIVWLRERDIHLDDVDAAIADTSYTHDDMLRDLREMKRIVRTINDIRVL